MNHEIEIAFSKARQSAASSEYDKSVCVRAIAVAYDTASGIPIKGESISYLNTIIEELVKLKQGYNDPDGEYTNGSAMIGTLIGFICELKH